MGITLWTTCIRVILATLRLTRFVTTDWLGEWTIVRPAKDWANRTEHVLADHDPLERRGYHRHKLVEGLECPFCVGFWLGAVVLIGELTVGSWPGTRWLWRLGTTALALNYVVGHVSSRIDG